MYMMVYKEITTGVMQIKHHIIEYTKDLPQLGIPNITKVDMASQTSVIRKVLMLIITAETEKIIEIALIFGWIGQPRGKKKC